MDKFVQNKNFINTLLSTVSDYKFFRYCDIHSLKPLKNQGLNNLVFLLDTTIGKYIVKKYEKSLHYNVSKKNRYDILNLAYKKSISSKPILFDKHNFLFIYDFIEAKHKFKLNIVNLKKLATSLKKLHNIKYNSEKFRIKEYFKSQKTEKELKNALFALKNYKKDFVLCHNDLNPNNILFKNRVKFIDFEYANINDRYFDLAAICIEFNLCSKKEKIFMNLYFKNKKINVKKLDTFKIIYKNVCYTWLKNRK